MNTFQERKDLITTRAKAASACADEYRKAVKSTTDTELLAVVKANFNWCKAYSAIDLGVLSVFPEADLTEAGIFISGSHRADGNATVEAEGNATVRAYGNATVEADGNANCYIYNGEEVKLSGYSIARFAPHWGAAPTRIELATSAHQLIHVELPTPIQS